MNAVKGTNTSLEHRVISSHKDCGSTNFISQHHMVSHMDSNEQHTCGSTMCNHNERAYTKTQEMFRKVWPTITDPNPLTLFGFRRFRTSHLLNLRALEHDILQIDHQIFQAGLSLGAAHGDRDRLALAYAARDFNTVGNQIHMIDDELIHRLRDLLQQYGRWCEAIGCRDVARWSQSALTGTLS